MVAPVLHDVVAVQAIIFLISHVSRKMRKLYAKVLYRDAAATLDDLREAVTTLKDTERIARRVLGGAHPTTTGIEIALGEARAAVRALENNT